MGAIEYDMCLVVSLNVPTPRKRKTAKAHRASKAEMYATQLHQRGVQVAGVQKARPRPIGVRMVTGFTVAVSDAGPAGVYGTELRASTNALSAKRNARRFRICKDQVATLHQGSRHLVGVAHPTALHVFVVLHVPHFDGNAPRSPVVRDWW